MRGRRFARDELEAYVGEPVKSRMSQKGNMVDLYEYVDGTAGVIGQSGRPMSGERTGRAGMTALFAGDIPVWPMRAKN